MQSYSDEKPLIPSLIIDSPDNGIVHLPAESSRPRSQPSIVPNHESYLPDFDFSLRGQPRREHPLSIDARRAMSATIDGLSRFSSMISPTSSSRPRSPTTLTPPRKVSGKKSKLEMTEKVKKASKDEKGKDPMPNTKAGLEARLNYHLSELDRLRKQVKTYNSIIEEDFNRLHDIQTRPEAQQGTMEESTRMLIEGFERSVSDRDNLGRFIDYHRGEIERIGVKNLEIRRAAGEDSPVSVVGQLGGSDKEWMKFFSVGKDVHRGPISP